MRYLLLAALLFSSSNGHKFMEANAQQFADTAALSDLRDRYRPLLVFAASDQDAKFLEQVHLLAEGTAALRERQVLLVPLIVKSEGATWANEIKPDQIAQLSAREIAISRRRFHVSPFDFTVILIGKDGGEKFRTHNPVTIKRLNTVIDAMPMRQQEIQDGHAK